MCPEGRSKAGHGSCSGDSVPTLCSYLERAKQIECLSGDEAQMVNGQCDANDR